MTDTKVKESTADAIKRLEEENKKLQQEVGELQQKSGVRPEGPYRFRVSAIGGKKPLPEKVYTGRIATDAKFKYCDEHGIKDTWRYNFTAVPLDAEQMRKDSEKAKEERRRERGLV